MYVNARHDHYYYFLAGTCYLRLLRMSYSKHQSTILFIFISPWQQDKIKTNVYNFIALFYKCYDELYLGWTWLWTGLVLHIVWTLRRSRQCVMWVSRDTAWGVMRAGRRLSIDPAVALCLSLYIGNNISIS